MDDNRLVADLTVRELKAIIAGSSRYVFAMPSLAGNWYTTGMPPYQPVEYIDTGISTYSEPKRNGQRNE